jgi:hypothetical protein
VGGHEGGEALANLTPEPGKWGARRVLKSIGGKPITERQAAKLGF